MGIFSYERSDQIMSWVMDEFVHWPPKNPTCLLSATGDENNVMDDD